jgi:alkylation response protein AidB-like acyl-CoA dehydrogenase
MDLTFSEEQEQIRDNARTVLGAECTPAHVRAMAEDARGYSPELWRKLADLGWHALALPEEHGGLGMSFMDLCLILEEQGRHLLPGPFVPTVVLGGQAVARFGTDAQRKEFLPGIGAGERVLTVTPTGTDGSWDLGDPGVTAHRDGDDVVLDGAAWFVPYAHAADTVLVVARLDEEPAGILVPGDASGLETVPTDTVARDHRSRLALSGLRVPSGAILGGPDAGRSLVRALAQWGAAARCLDMLGAGQRILEMTVDYAKEREAFGKPIGAFQAVQHHCANMAVDVLASRGVTYEAAWRLSEEQPAAEAVSVAKAWVGEAMTRVCTLGHQVHGATGYTEEHDLHLYTRRVQAHELDFGDAGWHRSRLARDLDLVRAGS